MLEFMYAGLARQATAPSPRRNRSAPASSRPKGAAVLATLCAQVFAVRTEATAPAEDSCMMGPVPKVAVTFGALLGRYA